MSVDIRETANHPIYPRAKPEEADGCAWVYYSPEIFDKYYYKLPALGDNDVRIRTLYAGLCHSDSMTGRGKWGPQLYPVCPGHEVVGEVINVGKNVHHHKVGEHVLFGPIRDSCNNCDWCHSKSTQLCQKIEGQDKFLYGLYFGGYGSHLQFPQSHCYKLPHNVPLKEVAPLLCAGVTVFSPMKLHLHKGMKVAILGVGGLGHLAVQIGHKMGCEVDAMISGTKDEKKNEFVHGLGAKNIQLWKQKGVLEGLVNHYDAIVYTIPVALEADEMDKVLNTLKPRGKLIVVGAPPVDQPMKVPFFTMIIKEYSIVGSCVGGVKETNEMLHFCGDHHVNSLNEHFEWEDFPKALEKLEHGSPKFRCVVNVDNFSKNFGTKH